MTEGQRILAHAAKHIEKQLRNNPKDEGLRQAFSTLKWFLNLSPDNDEITEEISTTV